MQELHSKLKNNYFKSKSLTLFGLTITQIDEPVIQLHV